VGAVLGLLFFDPSNDNPAAFIREAPISNLKNQKAI